MRYSYSASDGQMITLDDLAAFVAEMRGYRELPGDTPVRGAPIIEIDMADGPRLLRLTADPDTPRPRGPNRAQRRAGGERGPTR